MLRSTGRMMWRLAAAGTVLVFGFPTVAVAEGCEGSAWAAPFKWGPESRDGGAFFGYPRMRMAYDWDVGGNVETYVCTQGWGFDEKNPHGGWFDTGCDKHGGKGLAPWGNNAATPKFRARTAGPNGAVIAWGCGDGGPER